MLIMNGGMALTSFPTLSRTLSLKSWDLADFVLIKVQIVNKARQFHITLVLTFNYLHPVHGN